MSQEHESKTPRTDAYAQIQEALLHLEKIETVKLAARGLPNEASLVSKARVLLDRIIKNITAEKQSGS